MDEAITRKKKVTLDYLHYGYDKRQHPTATYTLSPYEMVYTNEHYYLICVPDHDPHTRLYRIDRMADIRILDEPRSETPAQKQEAQDAIYAFVGAPERVVLHCDRAVLDDVLDRFGTGIQVFERDEQTFTAVLTTPPRGVHFGHCNTSPLWRWQSPLGCGMRSRRALQEINIQTERMGDMEEKEQNGTSRSTSTECSRTILRTRKRRTMLSTRFGSGWMI